MYMDIYLYNTHTHIYIYIYIAHMYVCDICAIYICVRVCVFSSF